jgi:hypothetical protein
MITITEIPPEQGIGKISESWQKAGGDKLPGGK